MIGDRRRILLSTSTLWAAALVLLGLCSGVSCFDYELTVNPGQTVCFQDYVSSNNTITFGFSAFNVSSLEEMLANVYTGYSSPNAQDTPTASGSSRRILAQKKTKQPSTAADKKPTKDSQSGPASDFEQGLEEEQLPEDFETDNGVKFDESAVIKDSQKKKPRKNGSLGTALGKMWVKNQNNEILSPAAMKNFHIYKHRFDHDFSVIDICYQSLVSHPHYVRLVYTVHSLRPKETIVPSKAESDALLVKITKAEETFARFLSNFEQLEGFQRDFVSHSDGALRSFMLFAQGLLFCYLLLGYLMKLAVEKTLRAKKII